MGNAAAPESQEPAAKAPNTDHEGLGQLYSLPELKKQPCCLLIRIAYVTLCVINILLSIAVISVTVSTAIAMKIFSSDQSGRLVAMIILSVTSAVTLSMTIYAMVAVFRKHSKPVHAASVVLIVLAVIQSIIIGVSVRVTERDELNLSVSLSESFKLARADNPRHVRLWSTVQYDLQCCGVYGPQDYLNPNLPSYFAPDVPISCCPSCDPNRSELVQERERQVCKARKKYSDYGCRILILEMYKETAKSVVAVTSVHISLMVILSILGCVLIMRMKRKSGKGVILSAPPPQPPEPQNLVIKPKTNSKV